MVSALNWPKSYRIIPSRYPPVDIFAAVAEGADLDTVLVLEAATNPRALEAAGELPVVRPEDRCRGLGSSAVMAAFAHTKPSRFCDGTFGVYYAAHDEATAIAETAYHRARFLRDAGFPNERLDLRVYLASIAGRYDDLRRMRPTSPLYDPDSYAKSQVYAARLHARNAVDGIVYRSVRRRSGECVAVFRPRLISGCRALKHLEYRFENYELTAAVTIEVKAESANPRRSRA